MKAYKRFLNYIKSIASNQDYIHLHDSKDLGKISKGVKELGVSDAYMDQYGYVYGTADANTTEKLIPLLLSLMDTTRCFW